MLPCQCCQSRPIEMSIYSTREGAVHLCGECAQKVKDLMADPELLWLEAQWVNPCTKRER